MFERWMAVPGIVAAIALGGAIYKWIYGEHALGTSAAVPWGSLIAGYAFFAAAATGVGLIGAVGHLMGKPALAALEKRSLFLSLALLLSGFVLIGVELGNPFHLVYVVISPNFQSGIWWMSFLYTIYLLLLFIECYFSQVDPANKNLKLVGVVAIVSKVAAVCTLGAIFGLAAARIFWSGIYFPLYILLTAVLSGAAALILTLYLTGKKDGRAVNGLVLAVLGRIMAVTIVLALLFNAGKFIYDSRSGISALQDAVAVLVSGPLAVRFWVMEVGIGMLIPLMMIFRFDRKRVVIAAIAVLSGVFFMRVDFIMAGQIVPQVVVEGVQHVVYHSYSMTWTEWALIAGAFAASSLIYGFFEKKFNLDAGEIAVFSNPKEQGKGG